MVKTTINLRDDIYKRLLKETVEKYGNTKNFSKLINEKLAKAEGETSISKTDSEEIKKRLNIVRKSAGSWKINKSGKEYVKEIRSGWTRRVKGMNL